MSGPLHPDIADVFPEAGRTRAADATLEPPAFATVVDTDGRVIRLRPEGPGISLAIETGRGTRVAVLDRFQARALRDALAALDWPPLTRPMPAPSFATLIGERAGDE